ncbi:MAG: PilT/PilU family type 4a pilus ATPase [Proteobacteria bacterium]|nr:PilT/PilU family type 4a pilus ATPase [Pseudomonadota bacterium]
MARIDSFLELVVDQKASDLHFHAGKPPLIRHNGEMITLPFRSLTETQARRFMVEIMTDGQRELFAKAREIDFMYELEGVGRFRANVFHQRDGMGGVFRVIPPHVPTLQSLDLPRTLRALINQANGLVLVTGPTGCGKTTTLAALVSEINASTQRHIITIEDPIEFIHAPLKSVVTQREVGLHTRSFGSAMRSALREAPDVLVVGELRDEETISLALNAAETGVLVIGTLHTSGAAKSVNRVINALPEESREQMRGVLAMLLRGVLSQQLCRRANGEGQIAVLEVLLQSWAVANMIRENKIHQIEGYLQSVNYETTSMCSLDNCIIQYVRDGLITLDEGASVAHYPDQVRNVCGGFSPED